MWSATGDSSRWSGALSSEGETSHGEEATASGSTVARDADERCLAQREVKPLPRRDGGVVGGKLKKKKFLDTLCICDALHCVSECSLFIEPRELNKAACFSTHASLATHKELQKVKIFFFCH